MVKPNLHEIIRKTLHDYGINEIIIDNIAQRIVNDYTHFYGQPPEISPKE